VDCSAEWPTTLSTGDALSIASGWHHGTASKFLAMLTIWLMCPSSRLTGENRHRRSSNGYPAGPRCSITICPMEICFLRELVPAGGQWGGGRGERRTGVLPDDMSERFSDYVGVSMSVSPIAGFSPDTAYDSVTLATARDPEAARCATESASLSLKAR
jgi:hypothetical protein